ncbi:MAG: NAD-dependent epimerase/dehydratase family protein [Planctomycetes bacterium]|nr:NAD-dependent epimerase/dehydratase family protein [Planctomycetota bacterium]
MNFQRILITGGAGFVGANLAVLFKRAFADTRVVAVDNLKRRGSELNLPRLREHGVEFLHGDIRCPEDVDAWPEFELLIDCSAEPSVQAGLVDSPAPLLQNNLVGTINCLEAVRRRNAALLFLSTSRVYPIEPLNALDWQEQSTRFAWTAADTVPGFSTAGVAEEFPLPGARSLYGASKLASELLIQEYAYSRGLPALINRCGILTGPWQMGKVDQGVVTLWVARHLFGRGLRYTGFGGRGKQVRDMLHVDDLFQLLVRQMAEPARWRGQVYNVGGGPGVSASLCELTDVCQQVLGRRVTIDAQAETSSVDLRIYQTDNRKVTRDFNWRPERNVAAIVGDIAGWVTRHEAELRPIIA